jgi:hypothetical protein
MISAAGCFRPRPGVVRKSHGRSSILAVALFSTASAFAQDSGPRVLIHGFGDWAYGRTSGETNFYLSGLPGGNYRDVNLGLNVVAIVTDRLTIVGQTEWNDTEAQGSRAVLDYAFAEWKVSDRLSFRAGQVKQPFGISNEVSTVGTLRPFQRLPQAVYGPVGFVGLAYRGIGLTGSRELGRGWSASFDAYVGGTEIEEYNAPEAVLRGEPVGRGSSEIATESTKDLYGGRLRFDTPLSGLRIGFSGYQGRTLGESRRWVVGVDAEYLSDAWSVRCEYVHESEIEDRKADGFYLEVAYRFDRHWQAAAQVGDLSTKLLGVDATRAPSLLYHRELAAGLNYWFSRELVLKLSYHHVDGNRLAGPEPEDLSRVVASGQLQTQTHLGLLGVQFSF